MPFLKVAALLLLLFEAWDLISMKKTSQKRVKCLFLYLKLNTTLQIGTSTIHSDITHQEIIHLGTVSVIFVIEDVTMYGRSANL